MFRTGSLLGLAGVACAMFFWFTKLRANDEAVSSAPTDQIAQLLARVEKLERRVEALETKQQAARQIDSLFLPAAGWLTAPPTDGKPVLPHGALIVPPKSETPAQPALRSFLPRQVELKPE